MPTLNDLDLKLQTLEAELLKETPKVVKLYATDYLAVAINQIQKEGIKGEQYSTTPFYAGKSIYNNKSGFSPRGKAFDGQKKKEQKKREDGTDRKTMYLPGGYEELRQLNGLQTAFVDLTFSGRMFQNLGVVKEAIEGGKFLAFIGASNQEEKDKLSGHAANYKTLLRLNPELLGPLQEDYVKRFSQIIKKIINA